MAEAKKAANRAKQSGEDVKAVVDQQVV